MPLFPTSLEAITLAQWIDYVNSLNPLDEHLRAASDMEESQRKTILLTRNLVDRAYHTFNYFDGLNEHRNNTEIPVEDMLNEYNNVFCKMFDAAPEPERHLPSHELTEANTITFGQLIDAKMITADSERNKWELLQYVATIFCLRNDSKAYNEMDTQEDSESFIACGKMKMNYALMVFKWWENLNTYINENFTLFQDNGEPEKANMKEHMARWGWINFLKSIAKTKVFDISGSGLNSIDCARQARAATVLTWASEEKDYNAALSRDMKED